MSLWRKLRYLMPGGRRAEERAMQEELASLREMASPLELGNLTLAAENARDVLTWSWLEQTRQDLRYALHALLQNRVFTAVAVVSLALALVRTRRFSACWTNCCWKHCLWRSRPSW